MAKIIAPNIAQKGANTMFSGSYLSNLMEIHDVLMLNVPDPKTSMPIASNAASSAMISRDIPNAFMCRTFPKTSANGVLLGILIQHYTTGVNISHRES